MPTTTSSPDFAAVLAARRKHIEDRAECEQCGAALATCRYYAAQERERGERFPLGCCGRCRHVERPRDVDKLLDEIATGSVRTVEEAYPPPVLGPKLARPPMYWLLRQGEWWAPLNAPMVRIVDMTDTHRLHLMRWLEGRAESLVELETWAMMFGPQPSGDGACDGFEAEMGRIERDPVGWLRQQPLYEALSRHLPTPDAGKRSRKRYGRLLRRARHYSTCPRSRNLKDTCTCETGDNA